MIMKKILFCDNSLHSLINFRGDVINRYVEDGWEVVLVAPSDFDYVPQYNNIRYIEIQLSRTGQNLFRDLKYFRTLLSIYRKECPDYIFHYTIKPNIYGTIAAALSHIRSTSMVAGLGYVFNSNGFGSFIARILYRFALLFSEHIIVLNRNMADILIEKHIVSKEKLVLFSGGEGVNIDEFNSVSQPHSHNDNETVFLMVARVLYDKGYTEYVNAAKIIKSEYPNVGFWLLGTIDEAYPNHVPQSIVQEDNDNGYIKYLGFSKEVCSVLEKADCIVLPSYHEGLSRSLMEALAMGKPIIATDIPGCKETVEPEKNGYLVLPRNTESLVDALRKFVSLPNNEKEKMGKYSRMKAEREFDVKNVIKIYKNITSKLEVV